MRSLLLIAALCLQAPATTPARTGTLVIAGDVSKPATLTPADLRALPRTTVKIQEEGRTVSYEGVLLGELLKRAGAPLGSDLRGNALTSYVIASANDGYQVVFSLAELDPAFTSNDIIVADTVDGKPLFDYQGPLRIVAPKDTPPRAIGPHAGAPWRRWRHGSRNTSPASASATVSLQSRFTPARLVTLAFPRLPSDLPADNPMSRKRRSISAGIFFMTRGFPANQHSVLRASCHAQALAFTDGSRAERRLDRRTSTLAAA